MSTETTLAKAFLDKVSKESKNSPSDPLKDEKRQKSGREFFGEKKEKTKNLRADFLDNASEKSERKRSTVLKYTTKHKSVTFITAATINPPGARPCACRSGGRGGGGTCGRGRSARVGDGPRSGARRDDVATACA